MSSDIKLISLVKEFPDLYDTRRPNYKDTVLKETIWTEIANTLSTPGIRSVYAYCAKFQRRQRFDFIFSLLTLYFLLLLI